jgi:hypothetical protein
VLRDSVGASGIQIMVITPNLLCNAYLSNAHDWSDMPLLACPVAARRRDKNKIPGPAVIIFSEAHQKYKNNLLIFLQIAGPEAILIKRFYCRRSATEAKTGVGFSNSPVRSQCRGHYSEPE